MSLLSLRQDQQAGRLDKHEFIGQMHAHHALLFEYPALLKDTDISRIEIADDGVILTERSSGIRFRCDPRDKRTAPIETLNFGTFEKEDEQALYQAAEGSRVVFDIGANIGWYSLNLAQRMPGTQVYSFEPLPATFGYLKSNTELNGLTGIHLNNFGFSDREQELTFYFNPESSGSASLAGLAGPEEVQEVRCRVRRLDDFVDAQGVCPDFIKCDVEGAELSVFQGGLQTLERCRPVLFAEMLRKLTAKFGYHPNRSIALLRDAGYLCFASGTVGLREITEMTEETVETNFVFLHREKHAGRIAALGA